MAFIHGKNGYVSLGGVNLSTFTNNITFNLSADSHDTTTFGKSAHTFQGGLKNGTCSIQGTYDNGIAGPRLTIEPMLGTNVALVYRPEGTGSGKPQETVTVLVTAYNETVPVADMITWQADLQLTDSVATVAQ